MMLETALGARVSLAIVALLLLAQITDLPGHAAQREGGAGPADPRGVTFENITREAGVDVTLRSGDRNKMVLVESMVGGAAFVDFDDDGWIDLYLVNGSTFEDERRGARREPNRLFRNNGDGTFADVTERAGVGGRYWGMGVCSGDVDNNGWEDIYVTNAGPNLLLLNGGDGAFLDVGAASGVDDPRWSSSCAFADYDADGDLDLYVSNYVVFDIDNPSTRADDGTRCGYQGIVVACGPLGLTPVPDRFYENRGDGTFTDVTVDSGVGRVTPSYGMGVVWGDYDDDGDQDVYVANDEMANFLFRNEGDGTFAEVGIETGVALSPDGLPQGGMGVDFGDYDNDGDLDLVVTNFAGQFNALYRNEGNGVFSDGARVSTTIAPTLAYVGWGVAFVDVNLNGLLDLPVANGHSYPQLDEPPDVPGGLFGGLVDRFLTPTEQTGHGYRQTNQMFLNAGGGRFVEVGDRAGEGFRIRDAASSRGLATGDINNDGLMDFVITHLDEKPSVLLNRSEPGNWLLVDLRGTVSNLSAVGARVIVRAGALQLRRDVRSGGSYQSHNDRRLHFGLGDAARVDKLSVRWPSGRTTTLRDVEANRILRIEEQ